jgi:Zinc carboxypeptidase
MNRARLASLTCTLAFLSLAAPAAGAELTAASLTASGTTSASSCSERPLPPGPGVMTRSATMRHAGWVRAELDGPETGDWDLAVFDRASASLLASSSSFGSDEVAEGLATRGTALLIQACRLSGSGGRARLDVSTTGVPTGPAEKVSMVRVFTPTRDRKEDLTQLGLDLTEHGGKGYVGVLLHGADDARTLRENKFSYTVEVPDVVRQDLRDRAADARFASRAQASALPSGRDAYRRLGDYAEDMKKLVDENPNLVRPITLPHETWEGRAVEGIEITTNVDNLRDGKPVFLQMGAHHAREWPSAEHAMEWAFELVNGYKAGNDRTQRLVRQVRTIVIPVVNPDGFNISREAGEAQQGGDGRGTPNTGENNETANIVTHPYEYRRKNCRFPEGDGGNCAQPALGVAALGVDPNRNYGAFWGGPGASGDPTNETYYGPGPFSEPETQNIRELVSGRQVTTLITNHTFGDLVLRAPGLKTQGLAPDEPAMKALGDRMAAENGYLSMFGWQLYDTTGTTEDWSYSATGGYGYTYEIGCVQLNRQTNECVVGHFHPPFAEMVKEWEGTTPIADEARDGKGNREAYYLAMENALDAGQHSLLDGSAPSGLLLRLKKTFQTPTSQDQNPQDGALDTFTDTLDTTYEVPDSGRLEWHINPSTRPLVAIDRGRQPTGEASPPQESTNNPPPAPPCPSYHEGVPIPGCFRDHPIEIPTGPGIDNGLATIRVEWASPGSDYDIEVYRDANGNGVVDAGEPVEGTSGQGTTDFEQVTLGPDPTGKFVLRVVNFAAGEPYDVLITFAKPTFTAAQRENWTLSCETFGGAVLASRDLFVARGERATVAFQACAAALSEAFRTGVGCDDPTGRLRGRRLDRVRLGGGRDKHLKAYRIGRKSARRGIDRFCLSDRRGVRVGYPTRKLRRKLGRKLRRGLKADRAVLALTTSRRFRIRRVRVGTSERALRRRTNGRSFRIGSNRWYLVRARNARIVFKVKGGRVRELGLVNKRLTAGRRARRTMASWRLG